MSQSNFKTDLYHRKFFYFSSFLSSVFTILNQILIIYFRLVTICYYAIRSYHSGRKVKSLEESNALDNDNNLGDELVFATKQKRKYYKKMEKESFDADMLRLFEAFMEAAPQLILQLYVLTLNGLADGWYLGMYDFCI